MNVSRGCKRTVLVPVPMLLLLGALCADMATALQTPPGQPSADNGRGKHMTKPEITGIAPFFIVRNVPAALSFYRDRLGFDITFQGPDPDDIFFGIVQRGAAMIVLKDVGVDPLPNYKRDVRKGWARWDGLSVHVPDPDALAAEFSSRHVEFFQPVEDDDDGLRGFAPSRTLTATCCFSAVLVHERGRQVGGLKSHDLCHGLLSALQPAVKRPTRSGVIIRAAQSDGFSRRAATCVDPVAPLRLV